MNMPTPPSLTLPPEVLIDLTYILPDDDIPLQTLPTLRKTIRLHRLAKDAIQGDTGANCSATNNRTLLWDYKPLETPIPITTYQDQNNTMTTQFEAIGTGIIKMIVDDTTIDWLTLYTPNSTGTIISPDRFMMDNGHVQEFLQSGMRNGTGYLQFVNSDGKTFAKVNMKRQRDGLWYTDSPVLLPPSDVQPSAVLKTVTHMEPTLPEKSNSPATSPLRQHIMYSQQRGQLKCHKH
jgi:hypothetical protein